jgi:hypothetical protein
MSNVFFLSDGRNFIINPSLEGNQSEARDSKKVFLLGLNVLDLSTDKAWTAKAISALSTGMVHIGMEGKKRATKAILVERLTAYIAEERLAASIVDESVVLYAKQTLNDCSLNAERVEVLIKTLAGQDLVDGLASVILNQGYAPSTIVKTVLPDIAKLITAFYQHDDGNAVKGSLYARFKSLRDAVHKSTNIKVVESCNDRAITDWTVLSPFVANILDNIETSSWKHLSFAVALATGRRMSEVHGVATVFSFVDDSHLMFEGQLKTKERKDIKPYEIPCLFDAAKVIKAWEKLRELGRASYQPEEVNKRLSKALSNEMPKDIQDIKTASNLTTYKDLRDCYAAYCRITKPESMSTNAFLANIMGHGENDLQTASTYDKRGIVL